MMSRTACVGDLEREVRQRLGLQDVAGAETVLSGRQFELVRRRG